MKWCGWCLIWRNDNKLEGKVRHIIFRNYVPAIFHTCREAREYAEKEYGYIRKRKDLRREPYGWKMPIAARVIIDIQEIKR